MDRRSFLARLGAAALAAPFGAFEIARARRRVAPGGVPSALRDQAALIGEADALPVADWVVEENKSRHRTRSWIIPHQRPVILPAPIEGYLDKTSYLAGEELVLRVNTRARAFRADVYRMGYYGGYGARHVLTSPELVGKVQPSPAFHPGINMIECSWVPSWTTGVTEAWPSGAYLIKLTGSSGERQYVPFTVRDDKSRAAFVVQSSVTTWQAYNPFGGYSLYGGTPLRGQSDYQSRSRVVSFDRPYSHSPGALDARGSGDFLGNELPFIYLAERHGLDVTYATDLDLHARPELLLNHRCLVSLGHDEYWSTQMHDGAQQALGSGVNLAFLGANACYRQIRVDSSPTGPERRIVCYKDASEDPLRRSDPALVTGPSWATDPVPRPESALIGIMYQSYGGSGPLVVADGSSWAFAGTGLSTGSRVARVIGSEFDGFEPAYAHPAGVEILAHSPTNSVSGRRYADVADYATPASVGGVFATGTASWVNALWDGVGRTPSLLGFAINKAAVAPITRVTLNVLAAFGHEAASRRHPSKATWPRYYAATSVALPSVDVA